MKPNDHDEQVLLDLLHEAHAGDRVPSVERVLERRAAPSRPRWAPLSLALFACGPC